ncbi:MAG: PEP-CTERM sorting domain-containing protein [Proteobacteria bacterium]|nr:PEP-CTERM sorting domain-containing protein [Pseudomonadota bacterium]
MKKLAVLGLMTLTAAVAQADVLFDNGPVVNANGKSVMGGTKAYRVNTYGVGDQSAFGYSVADDFTVSSSSGWNVTDLDFFNYQTSAGAFTFTDVTWSIISGTNPNSGSVVASGTTAVTNGGLVGYRVAYPTLNNTDRAIYDLKADIPDVTLAAGSYWLTWSVSGTGSSGPWQPLTSDRRTGNFMQNLNDGNGYTMVNVAVRPGIVDRTAEAPFVINGTVAAVPEPATWASLAAGLGLLGFLRSRRRAD